MGGHRVHLFAMWVEQRLPAGMPNWIITNTHKIFHTFLDTDMIPSGWNSTKSLLMADPPLCAESPALVPQVSPWMRVH
jgi:hypothetical protein